MPFNYSGCAPLLLSLALASQNSFANESAATAEQNDSFDQCRHTLRKGAKEKGFSDYILNDVINLLEPLERVIDLDRKQPEHTESFTGYINKRVNDYRITNGKKKLAEHKALLNKLTQQYGVPARYIVAFWGLETNFGTYKGDIKVLNSIATLACDKRRSRFFTKELFHLFSLIDSQQVSADQLLGSWAGAVGHMQFMPSNLTTYGIDGDGDGKLNVWESLPDALSSAAHYLSEIGWNKDEIWGRRVLLPKNFDFTKVAYDKKYPLSHFKQLGITKLYNHPLPDYETQARLILPAGHTGPAFLVYDNFSIVLKWNYSQNYALAVGLLADSLININHKLSDFSVAPYHFGSADLKILQEKLKQKGYKLGKPDGVWGPNTRNAIQKYQTQNNLVADGFPNDEVFSKLGIVLD